MLAQPAQSLTDLILGAVVVVLALRLRQTTGVGGPVNRHWATSFWWAGVAALGGALHHAVMVRWDGVRLVSWALISTMVVLAVSYLLAATVSEVLGSGRVREFWALRSIGLVAYVSLAVSGHPGVTSMLACESLTMISVLVLWGLALRRGHPLAGPVILAIAASSLAAVTQGLPPSLTGRIGLDPTSTYHLAQIAGMVLLARAVLSAPTPSAVRAPRLAPPDRLQEPSGP